jgi:16S rRNA (guanine527-N7)-methyltransferase
MTIEELRTASDEIGIHLTEEMMEQLETYCSLLQEWNEKINLTAIKEKEEIIEKHFHDSLLPLAGRRLEGTVADVGTGAGFPGLVWKIVFPELSVALIEPTGKRCTFLKEVIDQLHLKGITVYNERAEEHALKHREEYSAVTARAVANLSILAELCVPLLKKDGLFIAMKGSQGHQEAIAAQHAMKVLGCTLEEEKETSLSEGDHRVNLFYRKTGHTPIEYPRNYGRIKKQPL